MFIVWLLAIVAAVTATDSCMKPCPKILDLQCANNGITYSNPCLLSIATCKSKGLVQLAYSGQCPKCKTGVRQVFCLRNPCENAKCTSNLDATCIPDNCGTCKAKFYDIKGQEVKCQTTPNSCRRACPLLYSPVCGSDGKTYPNKCVMESAGCNKGKKIDVLWQGMCGDCMRACPRNFDPICATNGFTQANACLLSMTICTSKGKVGAAFKGRCPICPSDSAIVACKKDPCESATCAAYPEAKCVPSYCGTCSAEFFNLEGKKVKCDSMPEPKPKSPMKACPLICTADYRPVCGSDGKTYSNQCAMDAAACRKDIKIMKLWDGECGKCERACTFEYDPICATNGFTQSNECALKIQMCKSKGQVQKAFNGECPKCPRDMPIASCRKDPCLGAKCSNYHGAICVPSFCGGCNALFFNSDGKKLVCDSKPAGGLTDCPKICTADFKPVCASDGKTYPNDCNMRATSCSQDVMLKKLWDGQCGNCERPCTREYKPICATNGFTQGNECALKIQICKSKGKVSKAYDGECPKCPKGMPIPGCRDNPCNNAKCPNHPDAKCVPFFCGGCNALFFNSDGKQLNCDKGAVRSLSVPKPEDPPHFPCPLMACTDIDRAVCGSDGKTYRNECKMKMSRCKTRKMITKLWDGECGDCKKPCTREDRPVCGSNGFTQANMCELKNKICSSKGNVKLAFNKPCPECDKDTPIVSCLSNPCHSAKCAAEPSAVCLVSFCGECKARFYNSSGDEVVCNPTYNGGECPTACPFNYDPVCGSNGVTYANPCVMKAEVCKNKLNATVKHPGPCARDCERPCPKILKPVCGTDGRTYNNDCLLQIKMCQKRGSIRKAFDGRCPSCPPGTPTAACFNDPCKNVKCNGHKDVQCIVTRCGICRATFYTSKGAMVTCKPPSPPAVKPGSCPVPRVFGGCGNLCENDGECLGAEKCCSNGCGKSCRLACAECIPCPPDMETVLDDMDNNGCRRCRCKARCPQKTCRILCRSGYLQDSKGCTLCQCKPVAPPPMPRCPPKCNNGIMFRYKLDSSVECLCKP